MATGDKKAESTASGCVGALFLILVMTPLTGAVYAWAAMLNWNWFAAPTLSLPRVDFWQAYGLSLVALAFMASGPKPKDDRSTWDTALYVGVFAVIRSVALVTLGSAVHHFVGAS